MRAEGVREWELRVARGVGAEGVRGWPEGVREWELRVSESGSLGLVSGVDL